MFAATVYRTEPVKGDLMSKQPKRGDVVLFRGELWDVVYVREDGRFHLIRQGTEEPVILNVTREALLSFEQPPGPSVN
jgi:hypothetical protein